MILTGRFLTDTNVPGEPEKVTLRALRGLTVPGAVDVPAHSIVVVRYQGAGK